MNDSEQHRRECEARFWLSRGYGSREKAEELRQRITAKRGPAAADRLIEDMRQEYRRQRGGE